MSASPEQTTSENAAEVLRLTLPMMSRHGVPATPQNYAVWYLYAAGEDSELAHEIDRLIGEGNGFSATTNARLYRKFVADHDLEKVEDVRSHLTTLMADVGGTLNAAGNDADSFVGTLDNFSQGIASTEDVQGIRRMLQELLVETREMRASNAALKSNFDEKSKMIEQLQAELRAERERAATDPLTGLYNRMTLIERIEEAIAETGEDPGPSVIMFDIDHFKTINDTHGHLIGDRVIRFVAKTLQQKTKGQDTAARFGGEEFTVLLPATPPVGAKAVAESIRTVIEAAQLVRADTKKPIGDITVSAGIATYRKGDDAMDLLNRADQALYRSKNDGRNRSTLAD
ncbi:MAG: GGDEF domain-containing protein [Gammaproteobacteria bacterium]|nr:GGDEF domain-containing protein [Gammaproteobacteria bacterium]